MILEDTFYYICLAIVIANMIGGWTVLFGTPVYYGRLSSSISKILIEPKLAWFLFEVPNLIWVTYFALYRDMPFSVGILLFTIHYINRDIIYPLSLKTTTKVPLQIVLASSSFTFANGYLQCIGASKIFQTNKMLLLMGVFVFFLGMWTNIKSDAILQKCKDKVQLDKDAKKKYSVVRGFLFEYVSSANYFGEIVEWFGYAMACQHAQGLLFAISTLDILVPAAIKRHDWNLKNIEGYPQNRKAVIPFVV